jgi:hypothetical protein
MPFPVLEINFNFSLPDGCAKLALLVNTMSGHLRLILDQHHSLNSAGLSAPFGIVLTCYSSSLCGRPPQAVKAKAYPFPEIAKSRWSAWRLCLCAWSTLSTSSVCLKFVSHAWPVPCDCNLLMISAFLHLNQCLRVSEFTKTHSLQVTLCLHRMKI